MRAPRGKALCAVALGLIVLQVPSSAASAKTYVAPFAAGPSGGDELSYHSAAQDGRVVVARAYPLVGPISCPGGGAYANLLVTHTPTAPVRKVTAAYTEAVVDPYVYLSVGVRYATGTWIGSTKIAGANGSGVVNVPVRWDSRVRRPLQVVFGLELSTACPHADGGTVRFTSVTVSG